MNFKKIIKKNWKKLPLGNLIYYHKNAEKKNFFGYVKRSIYPLATIIIFTPIKYIIIGSLIFNNCSNQDKNTIEKIIIKESKSLEDSLKKDSFYIDSNFHRYNFTNSIMHTNSI